MRRPTPLLLLLTMLALPSLACADDDASDDESSDAADQTDESESDTDGTDASDSSDESEPSDDGEAPAEPTVWSTIESGAGPDGVVPLERALQGFELLFGDLPGVELPDAAPDPDDLRTSGSGPLRWVLNHWDELSGEQQEAVAAWVVAPEGSVGAGRRQDDKATALPILVAEVQRWNTAVGARLGRTIPTPLVYLVDEETAKANPAWTLVAALDEVPDPSGQNVEFSGGPAGVCNVYFPPSSWRAVAAAGGLPPGLAETVAHEMVHCYQGFGYPDLASFRAAPGWIIEGGAEFGGIDLTGQQNPGTNNWFFYLSQDAPLFGRTYSAMGWWMLLQHVGFDPWLSMPSIWAGAQVDVAAYVTANGHQSAVYDAWGSSRARQPSYGDAWEVHGTAVTGDQPRRLHLSDEAPVMVEAFDARPVDYGGAGAVAGTVEIVELTANRPIRIHDAGSVEDVHVTEGTYCLGERCVCPPRTEREGTRVPEADAPFVLGVSGGETGTSVISRGYSLEEWCRRRPDDRDRPPAAPAPPPGIPPSGGDGSAPDPAEPSAPSPTGPGSNGDPHIVTFDGHRYDFQAVGEFVLAEADSGDLRVHVRQEPYQDSTVVAINTAVAVDVAGSVVEVRAATGAPEVLLDGEPVSIDEASELPAGGAIEPAGDGVRIAWSDGTELFALPVGSYGLNLVMRPADARLGTLHGLLGPYEGADELRLETREGDQLAPLVPGDAYEQLYRVFGDSWRITDEESLFTYGPGESTATFTDTTFPSSEVTLDDLTDEQRARGEAACAGIDDAVLQEQCIFDVGITDDTTFAEAVEHVVEVMSGGGLALGDEVGPAEIDAGEVIRYEIRLSEGQAVLLEGTEPCGDELVGVWRLVGPNGEGSLSEATCASLGRQEITVDGVWVVEIDASLADGGRYGFRIREAAPALEFELDVPGEVSPGEGEGDPGFLGGLLPVVRYTFDGEAGDTVDVRSTECDGGTSAQWGLEDPDGFRITLLTSLCDDLGEQTLTSDGTWSVVVFTVDPDGSSEPFGFTIEPG